MKMKMKMKMKKRVEMEIKMKLMSKWKVLRTMKLSWKEEMKMEKVRREQLM